MQKIVIFDMDGTLIDSKKDITLAINAIRRDHYNLAPLSEAFVVESINRDERNLPKLFYGTQNYELQDREAFEKIYAKQCIQNVYLYDGVLEMLQQLVAAGVKLGVATNAPSKFAKIMLESLGVASMFEIIIGADAVKESKPNPEMLQKVLEQCHYRAGRDRAWMVGDSAKDIQSAQNAKIEAVFVTWGFSPNSSYSSFIKEPKELLSIVL